MTTAWALLCAVLAGWAVTASVRLRHQRRVNKVAMTMVRHWRQEAAQARRDTTGRAVPMLSAKVQSRMQRNRKLR